MRLTTLLNKANTLLLAAGSLLPAIAHAQVSLYSFSTSVEAYTEITDVDGGFSLGTPTVNPPLHNLRAWADPNDLDGTVTNAGYLQPVIGPGFPIEFDFTYNGDVFDRIGVAHGGWISFGKSSDEEQAVVIFTSDHPGGRPLSHSYWATPLEHDYQRNRVAGWGSSQLRMQNMSQLVPPGPVSSLRVATIGSAPNRVCVIQWKDFRHNYSVDNYRINFQIRLNESDNSVEVRFGPMEWGWSEAQAQIGLGGRTNADYNNRVVVYQQPAFLYDWNVTAPGTINTAAMIATQPQPGQPNGSGVVPAVGRTYRWSPSSCPPPAWPVELLSNALGYYELQWPAATDAVAYDYVVTTEPDPNSPTLVAEGSVEEPYAVIEGLDTLTTYYVYIRTVCTDGPGIWGGANEIRSSGGAILECGAAPLEQVHCYAPAQETTWYYYTSDGFSPIRVQFTGGTFTNGSRFRVFDGADTSATVLWDSNNGGALPGQTFTSMEGTLTMKMIGHETAGCTNTEFLQAIRWTIGCKDCTDPLVNFSIGDVDCDAQEFFVDVNVFSLGTATTLSLENNAGVTPLSISASGIHAVGPFAAGEPVVITAANPANALCNVVAPALVNEACAIVDCGPTWYEVCLPHAETRNWLFQGDGEPVAVRFLPGNLGFDARIRSYNGPDELSPALVTINGNPNNDVRQSNNGSNQLLVEFAASAFQDYSCELGNSQPLRFVVGCPDGCVQPVASFAYAECTEAATYNVVVNITSLGSQASALITNDGGAPTVTANSVGQYTVGPFASQSTVRIEVEGANELCTWTSTPLTYSCLDISVNEMSLEPIRVFPNPNDGNFRIGLPEALQSRTELFVADISGRVIEQFSLNGSSEVALDLQHLPSGLYTLTAQSAAQRATTRISIQH